MKTDYGYEQLKVYFRLDSKHWTVAKTLILCYQKFAIIELTNTQNIYNAVFC